MHHPVTKAAKKFGASQPRSFINPVAISRCSVIPRGQPVVALKSEWALGLTGIGAPDPVFKQNFQNEPNTYKCLQPFATFGVALAVNDRD